MNELSTDLSEKISSKDIALLTGKQHKNIIRDIRLIITALEKDGSDMSNLHQKYSMSTDSRGYTSEYWLDKELSLTLATKYSISLRYKIIQRWQELERQAISAPVLDMNELTKVIATAIAATLPQVLPLYIPQVSQKPKKQSKVDQSPDLPNMERCQFDAIVSKVAKSEKIEHSAVIRWVRQAYCIPRNVSCQDWLESSNNLVAASDQLKLEFL